jgi:hypothetical protein
MERKKMLQQEARDQVNRVRQGVTGQNVWVVLALGLVGVTIVFALAYFYYFAAAPNPVGGS